jgi:hypothetical protein
MAQEQGSWSWHHFGHILVLVIGPEVPGKKGSFFVPAMLAKVSSFQP